ncbi:MAG: hypothetical protein ACK4S4_00995 [Pyrinomonadaceae bacterium]
MRWFFEGSNLFAFVCLLLAIAAALFGYVVPGLDSALQITSYVIAAVLAVLGVGVYAFNVINLGGGEAGTTR